MSFSTSDNDFDNFNFSPKNDDNDIVPDSPTPRYFLNYLAHIVAG